MHNPVLRHVVVPIVALVLLPFATASPAASQVRLTEHTLTRGEATPAPPGAATVADFAWLVGRWEGEGLGAVAEETWLPARGGAMVGVFRLTRDEAAEFYEIVTLGEEDGVLALRLKHFGPDLVGWEEKAESVSFPLLRSEPGVAWFDGLTIRRSGEDAMHIWVALEDEGETPREALFTYRRVRDVR